MESTKVRTPFQAQGRRSKFINNSKDFANRSANDLVEFAGVMLDAFDVSDEATIITKSEGHQEIVYANKAFEDLTGYKSTDIIGRNCNFLQMDSSTHTQSTDPRTISRIHEAVQNKTPLSVVVLNHRKDGTKFWNSLNIKPIIDASGQCTHFVGTLREIGSGGWLSKTRAAVSNMAYSAKCSLNNFAKGLGSDATPAQRKNAAFFAVGTLGALVVSILIAMALARGLHGIYRLGTQEGIGSKDIRQIARETIPTKVQHAWQNSFGRLSYIWPLTGWFYRTQDKAQQVQDTVHQGYEQAKESANKAYSSIKEGMQQAYESGKEKLEEKKQNLNEKTKVDQKQAEPQTIPFVQRAYEATKETAAEAADYLKDAVQRAVHPTKDTAQRGTNNPSETQAATSATAATAVTNEASSKSAEEVAKRTQEELVKELKKKTPS